MTVKMPNTTTPPPWGLTKMSAYGPAQVLPYAYVVLDRETQTGCYLDAFGAPVEVKHKRTAPATEIKEATGADRDPSIPSDERPVTITDEDEG